MVERGCFIFVITSQTLIIAIVGDYWAVICGCYRFMGMFHVKRGAQRYVQTANLRCAATRMSLTLHSPTFQLRNAALKDMYRPLIYVAPPRECR